MGKKRSVQQQFGPVAEAYATFNYHAAGPDLAPMLKAGELAGHERVLDIGSGAGHTALLFATEAREVVASDPTAAMLDQRLVGFGRALPLAGLFQEGGHQPQCRWMVRLTLEGSL